MERRRQAHITTLIDAGGQDARAEHVPIHCDRDLHEGGGIPYRSHTNDIRVHRFVLRGRLVLCEVLPDISTSNEDRGLAKIVGRDGDRPVLPDCDDVRRRFAHVVDERERERWRDREAFASFRDHVVCACDADRVVIAIRESDDRIGRAASLESDRRSRRDRVVHTRDVHLTRNGVRTLRESDLHHSIEERAVRDHVVQVRENECARDVARARQLNGADENIRCSRGSEHNAHARNHWLSLDRDRGRGSRRHVDGKTRIRDHDLVAGHTNVVLDRFRREEFSRRDATHAGTTKEVTARITEGNAIAVIAVAVELGECIFHVGEVHGDEQVYRLPCRHGKRIRERTRARIDRSHDRFARVCVLDLAIAEVLGTKRPTHTIVGREAFDRVREVADLERLVGGEREVVHDHILRTAEVHRLGWAVEHHAKRDALVRASVDFRKTSVDHDDRARVGLHRTGVAADIRTAVTHRDDGNEADAVRFVATNENETENHRDEEIAHGNSPFLC